MAEEWKRGSSLGRFYKVLQPGVGRLLPPIGRGPASGPARRRLPRRALGRVSEQHQGQSAPGEAVGKTHCEMFTLGMRCGRDWEEVT